MLRNKLVLVKKRSVSCLVTAQRKILILFGKLVTREVADLSDLRVLSRLVGKNMTGRQSA